MTKLIEVFMSYASSSVDTYSILLSHMIWKKSDGKRTTTFLRQLILDLNPMSSSVSIVTVP